MARDKVWELATGKTNLCMKVNGSTDLDKVTENSLDLAKELTKDSGCTTIRTVKAFFTLRMETSFTAFGYKIS